MQKVLIAFDIDGTLRNNIEDEQVIANERIRTLLITLSSFKNVKILVWSGGGELYARQCARYMGIYHLVDQFADKQVISCEKVGCPDKDIKHWHFGYDGQQPDIAIDDIHTFSLGKINLIVNEK